MYPVLYEDKDAQQDKAEMLFRSYINSQTDLRQFNAEHEAAEKARTARIRARAESKRKAALWRYTGNGFVTALTIWAMYHAQTAGLISTTITIPAYAIGMAYFGWCAANVVQLQRKGRWSK